MGARKYFRRPDARDTLMPPIAPNPERRARWRNDWLSSIEELANLDMQRATWLNLTNANPHYSYIEYLECYFTDLCLSDGYAARVADGFLSSDEAAAASQLHSLLDRYKPPTDEFDRQAILQDPRWLQVVSAAKVAQAMLATMLNDPEERKSLLIPSEYAFAAARPV